MGDGTQGGVMSEPYDTERAETETRRRVLSRSYWTSDNGSGPRWRWKIAWALDRLKGQCWSDLVSWVLAWNRDEARLRDAWKPQGSGCRTDAARTGACYCGKVRDPDGLARWYAEHPAASPVRQTNGEEKR